MSWLKPGYETLRSLDDREEYNFRTAITAAAVLAVIGFVGLGIVFGLKFWMFVATLLGIIATLLLFLALCRWIAWLLMRRSKLK